MRPLALAIAIGLALSLAAGCFGRISAGDIDNVAARLIGAVGVVQTEPQTLPPVLVEQGDTIIIDNSVTIIDDPAADVVVIELPDSTVLGFENDTGWDIYIQYFADGDLQGIFVYDGEALLLDYPCLGVIELISEDDIDPVTGVLVGTFDLTGIDFFNPDDFECGDAFILNFDPSSIHAQAEVVNLVP